MTEYETARAIAYGALPSPQNIGNSTLFAIRISGTGLVQRGPETAWRSPALIASPAFAARCSGLSVVWEHPPEKVLNSETFGQGVIGSVIFPYLADPGGVAREGADGLAEGVAETWGVARIFDAGAIELMRSGGLSTSPSVHLPEGGQPGQILAEGVPSQIDHVAIVERGAFDRDGTLGVRVDEVSTQPLKGDTTTMSDENKTDDRMDQLLEMMGSMSKSHEALCSRLDGIEADSKAKADAEGSGPGQDEKAMSDRRKADEEGEASKPERLAEERTRSDSDGARWAGIGQVRADLAPVADAMSERLDDPFHAETPIAYRRRLLTRFQRFSPRSEVRDADLNRADANSLAIIGPLIVADAVAATLSPANIEEGTLREVRTRDATGRTISTFYGKPSAWTSQFKGPDRYVRSFNKDA